MNHVKITGVKKAESIQTNLLANSEAQINLSSPIIMESSKEIASPSGL